MLSRFVSRATRHHRSLLSLTHSSHFHSPAPPHPPPSFPNPPPPFFTRRFFSAGSGNGDDNTRPPQSTSDAWNLTFENDDLSVFGSLDGDLKGIPDEAAEVKGDAVPEEFKPWTLSGDEKGEDVFDFGEEETATSADLVKDLRGGTDKETVDLADLLKEEEALTSILKGPNRAFGDLLAASGISDAMLDSLMALKDFDDVEGLPPLAVIEDMRYQKSLKDSSRAEMERLKQQEIAESRVRTVDEKGRAYGTGKRKCSIARVWIEPGNGKFVVNDKEYDVYFPMLDHRAALLRPFSETKTLGLWDVKCTVKGGGVSGQVGAIRLGVSRALQNWEPGLRPPLREAGFLTRDSRIVERKKPGKAKARKSFQWVKR